MRAPVEPTRAWGVVKVEEVDLCPARSSFFSFPLLCRTPCLNSSALMGTTDSGSYPYLTSCSLAYNSTSITFDGGDISRCTLQQSMVLLLYCHRRVTESRVIEVTSPFLTCQTGGCSPQPRCREISLITFLNKYSSRGTLCVL